MRFELSITEILLNQFSLSNCEDRFMGSINQTGYNYYNPNFSTFLSFKTIFLVKSFPDGSDSKESACNAGDLGLVLGLGRFLEKGMANHSSILA